MITYEEFINNLPTAGYFINGYKVYNVYFDHHLHNTIRIAGIGTAHNIHNIYCKHDFKSLSKNLFYNEGEALKTCLKKINDDLVVPLESKLKLCKDRRQK